MAGYSQAELYGLWKNFRTEHDATRILMDFGLCSKEEARNMIRDFETIYEAQLLDAAHRGKER